MFSVPIKPGSSKKGKIVSSDIPKFDPKFRSLEELNKIYCKGGNN